MPLTAKGEEILKSMQKQYGEKKGQSVFYASKNAGKISGVDSAKADETAGEQASEDARMGLIEGRLQVLEQACDAAERRFGDMVVQAKDLSLIHI